MDRKEIQKQRMMKYFIDATKEIIKEEGIKGITARKIGEKAGYSYATIYNYFNDLNMLLAYCVFDFLEDCYKYILSFKNDSEDCREQIVIYGVAYFKYFAENPDMFQLIFLEEFGEAPKEIIKNDMKPSVGLLLHETIVECAKEGYIAEENIKLLEDLIASSIHGKLLFFLKGRNIEKLDYMIDSIKDEIEFLIKVGQTRNN
ncbi:transcriptional regulator, TetR family [Gottschalkia purinilytica]|uniref:Transcriptional regulator, TetR family n=1 Tax=Gottschalkia purinilytica TaxID=1503 RepID=A0A0L0WBZ1_GOTPU|nr:TetR/AcrR family transcriptional regulator [Gottschalkia purinilytica]KNF08987.1 transcriptional regulator, TetR family [Gottschalkia purinilytica]